MQAKSNTYISSDSGAAWGVQIMAQKLQHSPYDFGAKCQKQGEKTCVSKDWGTKTKSNDLKNLSRRDRLQFFYIPGYLVKFENPDQFPGTF